MILPRRSFLTGIGALLAAPAVVRASSIMKISPIEQPSLDHISIYGGSDTSGWYIGNWVNVDGQARIVAGYDGSTKKASLWPLLEPRKKDRVQVEKWPTVRHEDIIVPRTDFVENLPMHDGDPDV